MLTPFNRQSLKSVYDDLKANRGLALSCMYRDPSGQGHWSYTGLASAASLWLTTDEIRALWVGGILRDKPINGVQWEGENRFRYGAFEFDLDYDPPAYLEDLVPRPYWMYVDLE
ncbi:hypothetical protein Pla8534_64820 [Lignipirellula cremea]|uniref:Uncharacterized protein n=2 Tax=Lignipirellula cremea TaxID=2528010 RepID=A0A518E3E2_9BACT|nr:hypothetical protein Pla8534_64820 [Lignipirellula cremea]